MASSTFDDLVDLQRKDRAKVKEQRRKAKGSSQEIIEKSGGNGADDLKGLGWRTKCAKKYNDLREKFPANDEMIRNEKTRNAEIVRRRNMNMEEHEELMQMLRNAVADDPWVLVGIEEIVRTHSGPKVVEDVPNFKALEVGTSECRRGLETLRLEMSERYEQEIQELRSQVRQKEEQIQVRDQKLVEKDEGFRMKDLSLAEKEGQIRRRDQSMVEKDDQLRVEGRRVVGEEGTIGPED